MNLPDVISDLERRLAELDEACPPFLEMERNLMDLFCELRSAEFHKPEFLRSADLVFAAASAAGKAERKAMKHSLKIAIDRLRPAHAATA